MAAEQGNYRAQHEVGLCYRSGYGTKKSAKKAVQWFQKSSDRDYAPGQRELGLAYDQGNGIGQDYRKAAELYAAAGDQGIQMREPFSQRCTKVVRASARIEKKPSPCTSRRLYSAVNMPRTSSRD